MTTHRRPLGNVLAAVDFSAASAAVIERAAGLPITPGSSITLLHVVPQGFGHAADAAGQSEAERNLAATAARLSGLVAEGVGVFTAVEHGAPFVEIIRRARQERAELVVLGRHGQRSFADALLGSTAERVLRKGDLPLLIVCGSSTAPYQRPMVAVDLSDTSRRALALALLVVPADVETIEVVHAWDVRTAGDPLERDGSALSGFLADLGEVAVRWHPRLGQGDARAVILAEASRGAADLLVIGTHGRSGLAHLLLGSVAEAVVRGATCDVLLARASARSFRLP